MNTVESDTPRVIVVVPTYNEAANVHALAERVLAVASDIELLIVDDDSPDGTGAIADEIAAEEPRFHIMHRTQNRGYAPSSREGLALGLGKGMPPISRRSEVVKKVIWAG